MGRDERANDETLAFFRGLKYAMVLGGLMWAMILGGVWYFKYHRAGVTEMASKRGTL